MKSLSPLAQNIGYGSCLIGLLVLVLGLIWLVNTFLQPGSPAVFEQRTTLIVTGIGFILMVVGVGIVWPRNPS